VSSASAALVSFVGATRESLQIRVAGLLVSPNWLDFRLPCDWHATRKDPAYNRN
jgi:hypothetical protein